MLRKTIADQSLGTDRWLSVDPLDGEVIERLFKKDSREGEEKLLLAVLADAIEHFQKYALSRDEKGRKLFQEAEEWFLEKDSDQLFSFEYICEILQLRPNYIRKGLLSWKARQQFIEVHRAGRVKLVKAPAAHTSVRRSKTAQISLMRPLINSVCIRKQRTQIPYGYRK